MFHEIDSNRHSIVYAEKVKAFTLVELLLVISIVSLLMGILMPVLLASRAKGKQILCQSNIRQLLLANIGYAGENNGSYAHAALDIYSTRKHRWHGVRDNIDSPFDPARGPFASYLKHTHIKCPTKVDFVSVSPSEPDYDEGGGGYGYNMIYIGSRIWIDGYDDRSCRAAATVKDIKQPAKTLMFADTAMAKLNNFVEHSFAEPRFFVVDGLPVTDSGWDPSPSIHFRHWDKANVGWVDGHVSSEKMGKYNGLNPDGTRPARMNLGWFEPMNNTHFDLK